VDHQIELISYQAETPEYRAVLAEKKPIRQQEFFEAGRNDIRPECAFVIWAFEYNEETRIRYGGLVYSVYRRHSRADEKVELYCEVRLGEH